MQLKLQLIEEAERKREVKTEYDKLSKKCTMKSAVPKLYGLLCKVNQKIWGMLDLQRAQKPGTLDTGKLCASIMELNDARYRIKKRIDCLSQSAIKEQKSFGRKRLGLLLKGNAWTLIVLMPLIHRLVLDFDDVSVQTPVADLQTLI